MNTILAVHKELNSLVLPVFKKDDGSKPELKRCPGIHTNPPISVSAFLQNTNTCYNYTMYSVQQERQTGAHSIGDQINRPVLVSYIILCVIRNSHISWVHSDALAGIYSNSPISSIEFLNCNNSRDNYAMCSVQQEHQTRVNSMIGDGL